jgi:ABC-type branched-subunit amino acid transport system ATPase component/MFS family permease
MATSTNGARADETAPEVTPVVDRATGRAVLGVVGDGRVGRFLAEVREAKAPLYPLLALGVLVMVDEFQGVAFTTLVPEISEGLGLGRPTLTGLVLVKTMMISLAALPMAAFVQHRARRASVAITMAFAWSFTTLGTGFVAGGWGMFMVLALDGASTGSVGAVHPPLLFDYYPPQVRLRVLSAYRGANQLGAVLAPLLVAFLVATVGLTWRGVFLSLGVVSVVAACFATRLRDPGFGHWDFARMTGPVSTAEGRIEPMALGTFEIVRRLMMTPTIRRVLVASGVLGMMVVPLQTYMSFFLDERWNLGPGSRALFFAAVPLFGIATLLLVGKRADALYRRDPALLVRVAAAVFACGVVLLVCAIAVPVFVLMFLLFGLASAAFVAMAPALGAALQGILRPEMRPHAAAMSGVFLGAVGGVGGLLLLSGIDRRFGTSGAIVSLAAPGLLTAWLLAGAARTINDDLDRLIDEVQDEQQVKFARAKGTSLPAVRCRNIAFSYGSQQVLFDVNMEVADGEMVALLGTNGAGKSTLLGVLSGLNVPSRGTVRYFGHDITYVDTDRRVASGIVQIPGGRAVFRSLSVLDNMRLFGYSHGADKRLVAQRMERAFEMFPVLGERRHQPAATLSGGEQQMLGLAKALILDPKLLLVDELSLGLAPKVVTELLDAVRRINQSGVTVVVVEQSVNVSLELADRAYFMEKGEVRFEGATRELLRRPDILRSVFLAGAAKGGRL